MPEAGIESNMEMQVEYKLWYVVIRYHSINICSKNIELILSNRLELYDTRRIRKCEKGGNFREKDFGLESRESILLPFNRINVISEGSSKIPACGR